MFADPQDLKEWPHYGKTMMAAEDSACWGDARKQLFSFLPFSPPCDFSSY